MRIYSDSMDNVILWDGPTPAGKTMDVDATDKNIMAAHNDLTEEILEEYGIDPGDDSPDLQVCDDAAEEAWERLSNDVDAWDSLCVWTSK